MLGLYLHIPFCHARCGYCDFVTFTGKEDQVDAYVQDLCAEMGMYSQGQMISTIFFGGGTPSVLEPRHIESLFQAMHQHFSLAPNAEITLEANPESITPEKAQAWRTAGINRISIGLQVFDDALLKAMGRLHTVEGFLQGYHALRQAGFDNLSIDLIYGFPAQTLASWKDTMRQAIVLQSEHLSLYSLKVEEHTPFAQQGVIVDDDLQAEMYESAREILKQAGMEQYEISNFARPGKECHHNLIYWRQQDYLGLGVGAVGSVGGLRWQNMKTLPQYHQVVQSGQKPRLSEEPLDAETRKFERLMLGLRLREGICWDSEDNAEWITERTRLVAQGQLEQIPTGRWRIPDSQVPFTSRILLPFL